VPRARCRPPAPAAAPAAASPALRFAAAAIFSALLLGTTSAAGQDTTEGRCGAGRLTGDVTGDGVKDAVALRGAWNRRGCRYWLGVSSKGVLHSLRLHEGLLDAPAVSPEARVARLFGLARIDSRPGAEVLVTLNRSASGEGVGVYRWRNARVRYLPIEGKNRVDGIFWHNQAGLAGQRVDCWRRAASGYVITLSYEVDPASATANIERRLWRADGSRFRLVWSRTYVHTKKTFPAQRTRMPFGHCLTRR
jgi:hypothetical protein